jgi:hypothetical protein
MIWFNMAIGFFLIFIGRRLFWLFVACVGFAFGYQVAQNVLAVQSSMAIMVVSILVGLSGAVIAIFFQKAAILVAGFGAASYFILSFLSRFFDWPLQFVWLLVIIGGIAGAVILFFLFDWALIFLSSLTGATLIVQTTAFGPWLDPALFLVLFSVGIAFQTRITAYDKAHRKPKGSNSS